MKVPRFAEHLSSRPSIGQNTQAKRLAQSLCCRYNINMSKLHRMVASKCLAAKARVLARGLSRIYEEQLRPHGVTVSQLNLMIAISCRKETRAADLAQHFAMEKSTVSRNLEGLKKLGWIRSLDPSGGRSTNLELTARGVKKLDQVMPAWKRAQELAEEILGTQAASALDGAAERIRQASKD